MHSTAIRTSPWSQYWFRRDPRMRSKIPSLCAAGITLVDVPPGRVSLGSLTLLVASQLLLADIVATERCGSKEFPGDAMAKLCLMGVLSHPRCAGVQCTLGVLLVYSGTKKSFHARPASQWKRRRRHMFPAGIYESFMTNSSIFCEPFARK